MPVFNGERFLESAIESNLSQSYSAFELIISDNASTDRTEEICRNYASEDARIVYIRNRENIGAAANFNQLFKLSRGEYFRWSNADDVVAPDLLESLLPILSSREDVVLAYGRTNLIDSGGQVLEDYEDNLDIQDDDALVRYRRYFSQVRLTNIIYGLMRSDVVAQTHLMGDGRLHAGDISFMAAMILHGKFVEVSKTLFSRRMHEGAYSAKVDANDIAEFWTASKGATHLPHFRAMIYDTKAILAAPLPPQDKCNLIGFLAKRAFWNRRYLAEDIRDAMRSGKRSKHS